MKKILSAFALLVLVGAGCTASSNVGVQPEPQPTNEQPAPQPEGEQPMAEDPTYGPSFKASLITVNGLKAGDTVGSPLVISGKARGTWFFEASFPIQLLDANGKLVANGAAQAQGEWMTTDFVPYSITLTFAPPATATGTLVFQKDNPSGLPQNDDHMSVPVRFAVHQ